MVWKMMSVVSILYRVCLLALGGVVFYAVPKLALLLGIVAAFMLAFGFVAIYARRVLGLILAVKLPQFELFEVEEFKTVPQTNG